MALQNAPTPSLIYPPSKELYLLSRTNELTANVADLIGTLAIKDHQIASMEAMLNDPDALKKRLEELAQTGAIPTLVEHPDIKKAQGNGKDATA